MLPSLTSEMACWRMLVAVWNADASTLCMGYSVDRLT